MKVRLLSPGTGTDMEGEGGTIAGATIATGATSLPFPQLFSRAQGLLHGRGA